MSEESISVSQYFECPCCKQDIVEEIMVGVQLCTAVTDLHKITEDSAKFEYNQIEYNQFEIEYNQFELDEIQWSDGVVDRFQCANCGWVIKDETGNAIIELGDLFEWLKEHKEKREKELNSP